jgi:hypothetical protein
MLVFPIFSELRLLRARHWCSVREHVPLFGARNPTRLGAVGGFGKTQL